MCTNPITIYSNSNELDINGSPLYMTVPCGHCAECRAQKQTSFAVRAYYEWLECTQNGGYAWMDTLTYDDEHIHTFKGLQCFDYHDVINFVKLVRRKLDYKGYNVDGNLRYLITGEYGEKRRRPHYHIMWYINIPIDLTSFWQICRECWVHGYNNAPSGQYNYMQYLINDFAACKYISKYVTKDATYEDYMFNELKKTYENDGKIAMQSLSADFKAHFGCIYRASVGFGLAALKHCPSELLNDGRVVIPDKEMVRKVVAMPLYLKHKYFYDAVKTEKGYRLKLNEKGIKWQIDTLPETIDVMKNKLNEVYKNLNVYSDYGFTPSSLKGLIDALLDGRDLYELAIYKKCYQNVLLPNFDTLPDMYDIFYRRLVQSNKTIKNNQKGDLTTDFFRKSIGKKVINEDSFEEFKNFDKLSNLFNILIQGVGLVKDSRVRQLEKNKKRLKNFLETL